MKLIEQKAQILSITKNPLELIERATRICYQSEPEMYFGENDWALIRRVLKKGHESVIEHASATILFVTNRGVTHEIVRHRLASYSQESTRYCNYGGDDMSFIKPVWWNDKWLKEGWDSDPLARKDNSTHYTFLRSMQNAERDYNDLLSFGWSPQKAREVLPNALKTEIVMTANFREWRHFFKLRTSKAAHPQMRALAIDALNKMKDRVSVIFEDINP